MGDFHATTGALLKCSFGVAPTPMNIPPIARTMAPAPAGNITQFQPMAVVVPFGMCTAPSNPQVAAAGGAPMPCIPMVTPWIPKSVNKMLGSSPVLNTGCKGMCMWGGQISILSGGQVKVMEK